MGGDVDTKIARVEERVASMAGDLSDIKVAMREISASLQKLTILESKHSEVVDSLKRAFAQIDDHETRMRKMEQAMPTLSISSSWVFKAAIGLVGMLAVIASGVILKDLV